VLCRDSHCWASQQWHPIRLLTLLLLTVLSFSNRACCGEDSAPTAKKLVRPPIVLSDAALRMHRAAPVIDGHNDLPWELRQKHQSLLSAVDLRERQPTMQTDIPRLRQGGVGAQFWSAYVPSDTARTGGATRQTLEQIDLIHRIVRQYPDVFEMASTADDVERIRAAGKIASLIGVEGGHSIENSLGVLRSFYELGARYMTLTHADTLDWADAATDAARHGGLSLFGIEVVREMNRLGMLVDISHVSVDTMKAALRATKAPVIASHSSAFAIAQHPRNVPDEVLVLVKQNRGVVMVNFFSGFVVPESAQVMADMFAAHRQLRAKYSDDAEFKKAVVAWQEAHPIAAGTVHDVVDHIEHIMRVAGPAHVGLGSDFDGVTKVPAQLEDVSCYPYITQELLNRGHSPEVIQKILGGNVLRALREAEQVARDWGSDADH
jgi:membrane dipeptidase